MQVGVSALQCVQTHIHQRLEQHWQTFHHELHSFDLDVVRCTRLVYHFSAKCACDCLLASDAQISAAMTHLVVICQDTSNRVSEILCGRPVMFKHEAASVLLEKRVLDNINRNEVWSLLQQICSSILTEVSLLSECVAFKAGSNVQLRTLHLDLCFNQ